MQKQGGNSRGGKNSRIWVDEGFVAAARVGGTGTGDIVYFYFRQKWMMGSSVFKRF